MPSPDRGGGEEGSWRLLNPLCIRFSQPRIAPHFRDGHLLTETMDEVEVKPLQEGGMPEDSREAPPYDCIIIPPFPSIRVISFLPKIRRADGEAERNNNGDQILGQRAWFALDNRRLYVLQSAAATAWPRRCCIAVKCLEEVPGSTARELRKFRTTTEGRTVEIGARLGDGMVHWDWRDGVISAPPGQAVEVEPDGSFAEDLWDAQEWAPLAVSIGSVSKEVEKKRDRQARELVHQAQQKEVMRLLQQKQQEEKEEQLRTQMLLQQERQIMLVQQHLQQRRRQQELVQLRQFQQPDMFQEVWNADVYQPSIASLTLGAADLSIPPMPKLVHCPESGWEYIDPGGTVRGPFGLEKMKLWHQHGFFFPELPMRCSVTDAFMPFSQLFPKPLEPFSGFVRRFSREAV
mmetsp:Transcript_52558/g.97309  ORF Transcript_52558/g.97309 Transcript_52558/m.97309 type:complete len:404 (-) Transcript_52558:203-1414(-)